MKTSWKQVIVFNDVTTFLLPLSASAAPLIGPSAFGNPAYCIQMKFRPCIDLHNGVVKQIVGSTLTENAADAPVENFVATKPAAEFARYKISAMQNPA